MRLFIPIFFLLIYVPGSAQEITGIAPLPPAVSESSALIFLENKLITINDSGNTPELFELDTTTGQILRSVFITNAQNVDWEALAWDNEAIYIGDFGNNNGSRMDLKVYKLQRTSFFNPDSVETSAEIIHFAYADQTDFSSQPLQTEYDAEAMIAFGDSIYIFTKNWTGDISKVYAVPKDPGTYLVSAVDSLSFPGLVTDATLNASGSLLLLGYDGFQPYTKEYWNFSPGNLFELQSFDWTVPSGYSFQFEGIAYASDYTVFLSSEENFTGSAALMKGTVPQLNAGQAVAFGPVKIFPNPVHDEIRIEGPANAVAEIYGVDGSVRLVVPMGVSDVRSLPSGNYVVRILDSANKCIYTGKIVVL